AGISPSSASRVFGSTLPFTATGVLPNESIAWETDGYSVAPSAGLSTLFTAPAHGDSATVRWVSRDLPGPGASAAVTLEAPPTVHVRDPIHLPLGVANAGINVIARNLSLDQRLMVVQFLGIAGGATEFFLGDSDGNAFFPLIPRPARGMGFGGP